MHRRTAFLISSYKKLSQLSWNGCMPSLVWRHRTAPRMLISRYWSWANRHISDTCECNASATALSADLLQSNCRSWWREWLIRSFNIVNDTTTVILRGTAVRFTCTCLLSNYGDITLSSMIADRSICRHHNTPDGLYLAKQQCWVNSRNKWVNSKLKSCSWKWVETQTLLIDFEMI